MWARRAGAFGSNPMPHIPSAAARGQALLELAVFGSLLLMVLSYLVGNILSADYQQQAKTEAFRRALASSAASPVNNAPTSTSHLLIQDRHIPDPSNPFGLGSISPVTGQAGITRNYQLQVSAENNTELPQLAIQISGATGCPGGRETFQGAQRTCNYTLAGFRTEAAPQTSLDRYRFVYGGTNVCNKPECGGGNTVCIEFGPPEINPETGMEETSCINYAQTLRIIDPCGGQIMSYDDCKRQARQITDSGACTQACTKAGMADCATMCSQPMTVPWYAQGGVLDALFTGSGIVSMGVQPGTTQVVADNNQLAKQEDAGGITSTATIDRTATTTRSIATVGGTGTVESQRTDQSTTSWSTPW